MHRLPSCDQSELYCTVLFCTVLYCTVLQGMVQSAEYIYTKLVREELLLRAHSLRPDLGTNKFPVVDI